MRTRMISPLYLCVCVVQPITQRVSRIPHPASRTCFPSVVKVSACIRHSSWTLKSAWVAAVLAILLPASASNRVVAWGAGTTFNPADKYDYGQSMVPATLTNAVQVAGGGRHSLALLANGTLVGWGDDSLSELDFSPAGASNYVAVACGLQHSLALRTNGMVAASAGDNSFGQIGVPAGLSNVVAIACGFYHSMALKADGTVVAWGGNNFDGSQVNYGQGTVPPGLSNVVAIAAGSYHNYRVYVTRLRSAGCPETTVRDIVWGDAERVFAKKRQELNLDARQAGKWSTAAERQMVADLLGDASLAAGGSEATAPGQSDAQPAAVALYPLVFQPVDLAALGFNDDQVSAVEQVRQQFIDAIGGTNQNPAASDYWQRWQQAQKTVDTLIRGQLGSKAYMQYEMAVLQAQQAAAQP